MTIQDDIARPWFQPVVPSEAQQAPRPDPGPPTTRIVGQLPLNEAVLPTRPASPPPMADAPERVEVTQPYIPAIRDERPEFAKLLNPEPSAASPSVTGPQLAVAPPEVRSEPKPAPRPAAQAPAAPAKKRSLVRRVVRRIIGPDLLRKDPPKKRR
ncbi:hypothetical protein [Saccharopolyspora sp. NPDC002686]|uniref:hypothetical protein n=1 Tax=Saccharopolyspora sp. NPDC002686 TaxID=3154541 RepID=UPI0033181CD5